MLASCSYQQCCCYRYSTAGLYLFAFTPKLKTYSQILSYRHAGHMQDDMTSNDMDGQITFLLLLFDFVFLSLLLRVASATERAASTHRTATDAFLSSIIGRRSADCCRFSEFLFNAHQRLPFRER